MTYECRLSPTDEPFSSGFVEIITTGNLNNPGEIFVVSAPDTLMAGENATIELVLLDSYGYLIEEEVMFTYDVLYGEVINNTYYAPTYLEGEVLLVDEVNVSYENVNATIEIKPNPSKRGLLPFIDEENPTIIDSTKVTTMGPVATPPESKAMAIKVLLTFRVKRKANP